MVSKILFENPFRICGDRRIGEAGFLQGIQASTVANRTKQLTTMLKSSLPSESSKILFMEEAGRGGLETLHKVLRARSMELLLGCTSSPNGHSQESGVLMSRVLL